MRRPKVFPLMMIACIAMLTAAPAVKADEVTRRIERPVQDAIATRRATQKDEAQWRAERETMLARYEALERDNAQLLIRKEQLLQVTDETRWRIAEKRRQLSATEQIGSEIPALIETVIQSLDEDIASGLPFLMDERQTRVARLTATTKDPEVTVSEKFRKVMETLMIEAEYGNTIEVYQADIVMAEGTTLVNVFRLGRLCLLFQTLDRRCCGRFNVATRSWETLPDRYNDAIAKAIEIGAKRQPVELLNLPVGRMAIQ